MHRLNFITSISVTPAKILSANKGRLMSGQSAEHSCEITVLSQHTVFTKRVIYYKFIERNTNCASSSNYTSFSQNYAAIIFLALTYF